MPDRKVKCSSPFVLSPDGCQPSPSNEVLPHATGKVTEQNWQSKIEWHTSQKSSYRLQLAEETRTPLGERHN